MNARPTKKGSDLAREYRALAALSDASIDTSDVPEVRDWSGAVRGRFYRPVKQAVTIRLDADVVAWFKSRDRKYQTAVNRALREYMFERVRREKRTSGRRRKSAG